MVTPAKTRVAVIGASGIGKHHARWWAFEGAEVCAFAGTTPDSVARAEEGLKTHFPFTGRGYTDVATMIETERPDIVDVCSPPPLHYRHAAKALENGCHVLCEKPLVYAPSLSSETLMKQARTLFRLAAHQQVRLDVCTQYVMAARAFEQIWHEHRPGEPITHFEALLETPGKNRPPDPVRIWADLSQHLISILLSLAPNGTIVPESMEQSFNGYEARARFLFVHNGNTIDCTLTARNSIEDTPHKRVFIYNDYPFTIEGQTDESGVYCSRIETPDGHYVQPDLMRLLIREFLAGRSVATLEQSLRNLELMLQIQDWT